MSKKLEAEQLKVAILNDFARTNDYKDWKEMYKDYTEAGIYDELNALKKAVKLAIKKSRLHFAKELLNDMDKARKQNVKCIECFVTRKLQREARQ